MFDGSDHHTATAAVGSGDKWRAASKERESITQKALLSLAAVIVLRDDRLLFQPPLKQWSSFTCQLAQQILLLSLLLRPFMRREPALSRSPVCPPSMKRRGRGREGATEQRLNELFRVPLKRILIHWPKTKPLLAWFHFSKA